MGEMEMMRCESRRVDRVEIAIAAVLLVGGFLLAWRLQISSPRT